MINSSLKVTAFNQLLKPLTQVKNKATRVLIGKNSLSDSLPYPADLLTFSKKYGALDEEMPVQTSRSTLKDVKSLAREELQQNAINKKKKATQSNQRKNYLPGKFEQEANKTKTITDQRQSIHFSIIEPSLEYINNNSSAHTTTSFFSKEMHQPRLIQRPTLIGKPQIMIGGGNYPVNLNSISMLTQKHSDLEKKELDICEPIKEKASHYFSQANWMKRQAPPPPILIKRDSQEEQVSKLQNAKIKEKLEEIKKKEQLLRSQTTNININININNFGPTYSIYNQQSKARKYSPSSHSNPFKHFRINKALPLRSLSDRNLPQFNAPKQKQETTIQQSKAPLSRINLTGQFQQNYPEIQSKIHTHPLQPIGLGSPSDSLADQVPHYEKVADSSILSPERQYFSSQVQNSEALQLNRRYFQNRLYNVTNKKLKTAANQQKEGIKRKKLKRKELRVHTPTPKNTQKMTLNEALGLKKQHNKSLQEQKHKRKAGMYRGISQQQGLSQEGQIEVLRKNSMMTDYQEFIKSRSQSRSSIGNSEFSHNYGGQLSQRGVVFSGDGENSRRKSSRYYL